MGSKSQGDEGIVNLLRALSNKGADSRWAVVSIVLGIIGLGGILAFPTLCLPINLVGLITGIAGVKSSNRGMAVSGIILNSVDLLLNVAIIVFVVDQAFFRSSFGNP
jgi:hypothetical protein